MQGNPPSYGAHVDAPLAAIQPAPSAAGGTTYKLDPAAEGDLAGLVEPLGDAALAQQLRDW